MRAEVRRGARVLVTLHTVEGEEVRRLGPVDFAGGVFDERIQIDGLAAGFYLCRLEADGERLAKVFTVAR